MDINVHVEYFFHLAWKKIEGKSEIGFLGDMGSKACACWEILKDTAGHLNGVVIKSSIDFLKTFQARPALFWDVSMEI